MYCVCLLLFDWACGKRHSVETTSGLTNAMLRYVWDKIRCLHGKWWNAWGVSNSVQQRQMLVMLKIGLLFALHFQSFCPSHFLLFPSLVSFSFVKPVRYEAPVLLMNNEAKPKESYCNLPTKEWRRDTQAEMACGGFESSTRRMGTS